MLQQQSVNQILSVIRKFNIRFSSGDSIVEAQKLATKDVAREYGIEWPTISDLQTRRLEIRGIDRFRNLLEKMVAGNPEPLMNTLLQHTETQYHSLIQTFFEDEHNEPAELSTSETPVQRETFRFCLDRENANKLNVLALMKRFSTPDWLSNIVAKQVSIEYSEWIKSQTN